MTRLAEIEAREQASTPGDFYDSAGDVFQEGTREQIARCTSLSRDRADARFFAQAKTDIPWLLEKLKAVERAVEQETKVVIAATPRDSDDPYYRGRLSGLLFVRDRILKRGE